MKNISKIILLFSIYFLPFLILGMTLDLSMGIWWSLVLFIMFIFSTYFMAPLFILGSVSATKKEDRRFSEIIQEIHQVAFGLRMNPPKIYYTASGTPSVWGFGLKEKTTYLIIHQELLEILNAEERVSIITYQLLRMQRQKLALETFIVAVGLWFYYPFKFIFRNKSGFLTGAFILGSSIIILIIEMLHSTIFKEQEIYQIDQKTIRKLSSTAAYVSALTKLDCHETQLNFNERFLLIISTLKPTAHKDFFNFFLNFPTSKIRIDLLQSGRS